MSENNKKEGFIAAGTKKFKEDLAKNKKLETLHKIYGTPTISVPVNDKFGNVVPKYEEASAQYTKKNKNLKTVKPIYEKNVDGYDSAIEGEEEVTEIPGLTDYWTKQKYNCLGWAISDALDELSCRDLCRRVTAPNENSTRDVENIEADLITALRKIGCRTESFVESDITVKEEEVNNSNGSKYIIAMRTGYAYSSDPQQDRFTGYPMKNEGMFRPDYHFAKYAYNQGWTHKMANGELYKLKKYDDSIWKHRNFGNLRTIVQKEGHKVSHPRISTLEIVVEIFPPALWKAIIKKTGSMVLNYQNNLFLSGVVKENLPDSEYMDLDNGKSTSGSNANCVDLKMTWSEKDNSYVLSWKNLNDNLPQSRKIELLYSAPFLNGKIKEGEKVNYIRSPLIKEDEDLIVNAKTLYLNAFTNTGPSIKNINSVNIIKLLEEIINKKQQCFSFEIIGENTYKLKFDTRNCINNILDCFHYDSPTKFLLVSLTDEKKFEKTFKKKYRLTGKKNGGKRIAYRQKRK